VKIDIGIKDADRKAIADGLSRLLADTYTLYLKTHNFHWNVTAPCAGGGGESCQHKVEVSAFAQSRDVRFTRELTPPFAPASGPARAASRGG
jgi:hypothetical protein